MVHIVLVLVASVGVMVVIGEGNVVVRLVTPAQLHALLYFAVLKHAPA
jgi:hypothetical protein